LTELDSPVGSFLGFERNLFTALQPGLDRALDTLFARVDQGLSSDSANVDIDQRYIMNGSTEDLGRLTRFGSVLVSAEVEWVSSCW
jgi:hypothetical protein